MGKTRKCAQHAAAHVKFCEIIYFFEILIQITVIK